MPTTKFWVRTLSLSPTRRPRSRYIPAADDADGDGLVQDGTEWEREVGVEIPQEEIIETNEENN
jgi:hypothetical protein